jgi:hypothetical protein
MPLDRRCRVRAPWLETAFLILAAAEAQDAPTLTAIATALHRQPPPRDGPATVLTRSGTRWVPR